MPLISTSTGFFFAVKIKIDIFNSQIQVYKFGSTMINRLLGFIDKVHTSLEQNSKLERQASDMIQQFDTKQTTVSANY